MTTTISFSGLGSGIDWQSIVSALKTADEASLSPYTSQITEDESKITAWESFNSLLTTLETASETLESASGLDLYSTAVTSSSSTTASELLTATASTSASAGSYKIVVSSVAEAEKRASSTYSSETSELGVSGTILINGDALTVSSTDTLETLKASINDLSAGVTASIMETSSGSYKLVLTSDSTGSSGISLLDGSSSSTLESLGFCSSSTSIKNAITGGAESDSFSSSSTAVETLLGNTDADSSGTVTINGTSATIDLSDSLTTIASTLTAAGISASVISTTSGSTTTYRLSIEGMTTYTDDNNVLQSLGLIEGDTSDVEGATGSVANTTDGSTAITSSSLISDIYGYSYTSGDSLTISGTTHSGTSVSSTLDITSTTTVSDLLSEIESTFGDVTASVTSAGKIQVVDNTTGTTDLSVSISSSLKGTSTGSSLSFGTFTTGTVQQYVLQDGTDASLTVDGVSVTSSSNTITTAIEGVTLNLTGASSSTTLTLTVSHDVAAIETEISAMISAYNDVMSYVNAQMSYDSTSATTGGVLFGDTTLLQIKQQLQSTILDSVGSGTFSYLSQIGIDLVSNAQLSFDTTTFESVLSSDFEDVVTLFAGGASSSSSQIQYVYSNSSTEAGTYTVIFTQAEGTDTSVAGSIDGYAASGSGDVLSLSNSLSGANGLEVNYLGTYVPTTATITISRGIATLLSSLTDGFTNSTDGTITLVEDGLTSNIGQLATRISQMQSQIDMQISNLTVEYEDMDTYVASMNALQSYLTTQLSSL